MKNVNRSIPFLSALGFGIFLSLALVWAFWQPAQAEPVVLFAAPTASGSGDCSDWNNACTLQAALANASSGDQIWVKAGLHKPGVAGERGNSFALKPGVEVYGGFAGTEDELTERDWETNLTVLSGDIDSNDTTDAHGVVTQTANINGENSYHVLTASSPVTESARLDGFVITAGQANSVLVMSGGGMDNVSADPTLANLLFRGNLADRGGGMHNYRSSPVLSNVTFDENLAGGSGGGMANVYYSSPTLSHVTFSSNSATNDGGGMYNWQDANPSLTDCLFHNNIAAAGGGMSNVLWANPSLTRVIFDGNRASSGGGLASSDSAHPALDGVTFQDNIAVNGGGMWTYYHANSNIFNTRFIRNQATNGGGLFTQALTYSPHVIVNAVFLENTASNHGGAIYSDGSQVDLTNVTLHDNSAGVRAGAFYNTNSSSSSISNVILWDNNAPVDPEIYNESSSSLISYSLLEGSGGSGAGWNNSLGTDGGGNLDSDPVFLDAASGDLHLQKSSSAIDAGKNSALPTGILTDLDGNPRFADIPSVPDTGNGTPPIVDMGAYEAGFAEVEFEKFVLPAVVAPGQSITFTLSLTNNGIMSATQVVLTDTLPVYLIDRSVTWRNLLITDTGTSQAYVWEVQDIGPGAGGYITITGVLSTPLTSDFYTNTAVIAYESGVGRMSSTAEVTYTVLNLVPAFTSTPVMTATQDLIYTYLVTTEDWNGDALTITASTLPGWLTLTDHHNGAATLSGLPTVAEIGEHAVSLLAADPGVLTATQSFTLTVWGCIYLPVILR